MPALFSVSSKEEVAVHSIVAIVPLFQGFSTPIDIHRLALTEHLGKWGTGQYGVRELAGCMAVLSEHMELATSCKGAESASSRATVAAFSHAIASRRHPE